MNIQTLWRYAPVTLLLISACVAVALLQMAFGVSIDNPSNRDLIRYGANFLPLTLGGEPWRIVSAGFLHIGILHLLFNCFALYYFGQVAERIAGASRFLALFILCVMMGNALTLFVDWAVMADNALPAIAAGASGGIMGIGGYLLVLALTRAPITVQLSAKNLAIVMGLNLLMGFAVPGINNAGHIGGLIAGLLLGLGFRLELHWLRLPLYWLMAAFLCVLAGWFLLSHRVF